MSVDYYGRLEQGRSTQPSPQMLRAMARALRLSDDEADHLYRLAGHAVPDRPGSSMHVRPALLFVLDQLRDGAAFVCSDTYIVLAQNPLARLLMGDLVLADNGFRSSIAWQWFTDPHGRDNVPQDQQDKHSKITVADLRAAWARRRDDADMRELVENLLDHSAEFRELWARHEVAVRRMQHKTFRTGVGDVTLDCEVLATDHSQMLVVLTPPPGSSALEDLQLLKVVGDQAISRP
jgi:hypothetical protein